jgi:small neutral amino acid transporter SnatA (MarC family)
MRIIKERIKKESAGVKREIRQRTIGYILTAFGLIAGLAWNDAVKSLIEYFFPFDKNTIFAKFIYAVLITFILVILSVYLIKLVGEKKEEK